MILAGPPFFGARSSVVVCHHCIYLPEKKKGRCSRSHYRLITARADAVPLYQLARGAHSQWTIVKTDAMA